MSNTNAGTPASLAKARKTPEKVPEGFLKTDLTTVETIWPAPNGYRSAGVVIVENFMLLKDTVPDEIHQRAENQGDVIIKLSSETITKDGRMVGDRITAEYFVPKPFLCC